MKEEMNSEQKQAATPAVTPPPFRPSEEPQAVSDQPAEPTLGDRIAEMGLDEHTTSLLGELTDGLRGRNEKIETMLHPQPQDEDEPPATPVFPRYCRRSIWD